MNQNREIEKIARNNNDYKKHRSHYRMYHTQTQIFTFLNTVPVYNICFASQDMAIFPPFKVILLS